MPQEIYIQTSNDHIWTSRPDGSFTCSKSRIILSAEDMNFLRIVGTMREVPDGEKLSDLPKKISIKLRQRRPYLTERKIKTLICN